MSPSRSSLFAATSLMALAALASPSQAQSLARMLEIRPGIADSDPQELTEWNGTLYFRADATGGGNQLFRSDGSPSGTYPLTGVLRPEELTAGADRLFFIAFDPILGYELWMSDGTSAGTTLVRDIAPGPATSRPDELTMVGNTLFFVASGGQGRELWKSDGTPSGTVQVANIRSGAASSNPRHLTAIDGRVWFAANDGLGHEPWVSDGTQAGTFRVHDVLPGILGSEPDDFTELGGRVYFSAAGRNGRELWVGDNQGAHEVRNINPGTAHSQPSFLTVAGTKLFFSANDGVSGHELWFLDGGSGIVSMIDINPGSTGSSPLWLVRLGDSVLFTADDGTTGHELWTTNGTRMGTRLLRDIHPTTAMTSSSWPRYFARVGSRHVWFQADDGANGTEPWRTDGTTAGTGLYQNINPGTVFSLPEHFTPADGRLFFAASTQVAGRELWVIDPGATSQEVGMGSGGNRGLPGLGATDPVQGQSVQVTGRNAPTGSLAVMVLGFRAARPFQVLGTGYSHVEATSAFVPLVFPTGPAEWNVSFPIQANPTLAGLTVTMQVWYLPTAAGAGIASTNAVVLTLGQ